MILSNGRFLAAQELFELVGKDGQIDREVAQELVKIRQPTLNDSVFGDAVSYLTSSGVIQGHEGAFFLSATGKRIFRDGEASRLEVARAILQKLIIKEFPELIALAYQTPLDRLREPDLDTRSCLDECQLLGYELSEDAAGWWQSLRALGVYEDDPTKSEVGRRSENKSVEFEIRRLGNLGCESPSDEVHLLALENDLAGFDVLSLNYGWRPNRAEREALRIEVKTGRIESDTEHFSLVISSRELEIAQSGSGLWLLHVWFTGESKWALRESPVTLELDEVMAAAPKNTHSSEWQTSRLFFKFPR